MAARAAAQRAFVFDLDGVLQRGGRALPRAHEAMRQLYDARSAQWTVPTAFLTNGGGEPEQARAARLSDLLDVPVSAQQIVLSHTPLRCLRRLVGAEQTALTVGGPGCAAALRHYGFAAAVDAAEIAALDPSVAPFASPARRASVPAESAAAAGRPVGLVAVMADSRDWGRDIQIVHDALCANARARVALCNGDRTFPTAHGSSRLAGGMFGVALQAVHAAACGDGGGGGGGGGALDEERIIRLGKPRSANFGAAERALAATGGAPLPQRIWMVGDNVASDVVGAVRRGGVWRALLVRSGNYADGDAGGELAEAVLDDVADAVAYGLER